MNSFGSRHYCRNRSKLSPDSRHLPRVSCLELIFGANNSQEETVTLKTLDPETPNMGTCRERMVSEYCAIVSQYRKEELYERTRLSTYNLPSNPQPADTKPPLVHSYTFQVPANRTTHRAKMAINHHIQSNDTGDIMSCVVLICSFLIIGIFAVAMLFLHFSTKRDQKLLDLEAYQHLLDEENPGLYGTSQPSPHTQNDPDARKRARRERVCNDISGVYRNSVQRLEDAEASSSSDESVSDITSTRNLDTVADESGEGSSESESESSDGSSSESPEDVKVSRLMSIKKPLLPKRVAVLKGI